jgi:hypothetical protein
VRVSRPKNFKIWNVFSGAVVLAIGLAVALVVAYQTPFKLSYQNSLSLGATLDESLSGFFPAEKNESFSYRWTEAEFGLEQPLVGRQNYAVRLEALSVAPNPAPVKVLAEAQEIFSFIPTPELQIFSFNVPPSALAQGGTLALTFETTPFQVSGDNRKLGVLLKSLEVESRGGNFVLPPLAAFLAVWSGFVGLYLLVAGLINGVGRFAPRGWLAILVFLTGLGGCTLAAFDRVLFAAWLPSVTLYMAVAVFCLYFFLLGAFMAEKAVEKLFPNFVFIIPVKPRINREDISPQFTGVIVLVILAVALTLRLLNLESLPIFLDEALHINAARLTQTGDVFGLATDGKALHNWIAPVFYLFGQNWLLLTRLFSVVCAVVTLGCMYVVASRLHSRLAGLVAMLVWAVVPFAVFHERMALVDSLMTALTAMVLGFSLRLVEASTWYRAVGWGFLTAVAMTCAFLTKVPAIVVLCYPGFALLLVLRPGNYFKRFGALGVVCCFTFMLIIPVISAYNGVWNKSQVDQKLSSGLDAGLIWQNIGQIGGWLADYLTLPVFGMVGLAIIGGWWQKESRLVTFFLVLSSVVPLVVLAVLAEVSFPRYFLFTLVPLLVLVGVQSVQLWQLMIKRRKLNPGLALVGLVVFVPAFWFNWQTITQPASAVLPAVDRFQYIEGWASGYGVNETVVFLQAQAVDRPVNALTLLYPITAKDSLEVALQGDNRVQIQPILPPTAGLDNRIRRALRSGKTFLVLTNPQDLELLTKARQATPDLAYNLVFSGNKPASNIRIEVYEVVNRS